MTATSVVTATAVITAGMTFAVMMVMMVALNIGIKAQIASQEVCDCCIGVTAAAAVKLNTSLGQSHLGTTTDTAADQNICIECAQNTCQSAVAAAIGVYYFGSDDVAILHFVNLELLGVTEMLEDLTAGVSYCDSHDIFAPLK